MKLRTHTRDERGAVAVIAAAGLVLAMIAASLAVDLGSLAHEARQNQKVADLAALDAVRALDDPSPDPVAAAVASAVRNEFECPDTDLSDDCGLTVQWSDSLTGVFTSLPLTLPLATTVRVTAKSRHDNDFRLVSSTSRSVSRKASAALGNGTGCYYPDICEETETAISPLGTVRVGSSLATISSSESTILNTLLNRTVGGNFTTSAVGWQGLAAGNVSVGRLQAALGLGSPSDVLDANVKYRRLLDATVDALNADGSPSSITARNFLVPIRDRVSPTVGSNVHIERLLDVVGNVGSGNDVADAAINVKDIVVGGMILANGNNFVSMDLTATDIPGLPLGITTVKFGLIEAPQEKPGPAKDATGVYRTTARTAQVRLLVESNLVVPITGLGNINLKIPYYLHGAGAAASIDTITCSAGSSDPDNVKIFGETYLARTSLGTVTNGNLTSPSANVVAAAATPVGSLTANVLLTSVTLNVSADGRVVSSVPGRSGMLTFTPPYDGSSSQPVPGSTALALPAAMNGQLTVTLSSLVGGLTLAGVESDIYAAVNPTLAPLNNHLVKPLQKALGVSLGAADVWAPPVQTCEPTSFNTGPTSVGPDTPYGYQIPSLVE